MGEAETPRPLQGQRGGTQRCRLGHVTAGGQAHFATGREARHAPGAANAQPTSGDEISAADGAGHGAEAVIGMVEAEAPRPLQGQRGGTQRCRLRHAFRSQRYNPIGGQDSVEPKTCWNGDVERPG